MSASNHQSPSRIWVGALISLGVISIGLILCIYVFPLPQSTTVAPPIILKTAYPTLTPQLAVMPTDNPSDGSIISAVRVGTYVQINGTEGEGLRFRKEPLLGSDVLFVAMEAEAFLVQDGPTQADGYDWYYLVAPYDKTRAGWAVSEYFVILATPAP